jgi:hypothetical protein
MKSQLYKTTAMLSARPSLYIGNTQVIKTVTIKERAPIGTSPSACRKTNELIFPRCAANTGPIVVLLPTC